MFGRKAVNEVFTPRNSNVNADMYIGRPYLEKVLFRSVMGSMHSFLFGESGNGKSWMYKNVFYEKSINHVIANCANASRKNSITDEIYSVCVKTGSPTKTSYKEKKEAGISAGFASADLSHEGEYQIKQEDNLITAFDSLSKVSSGSKSVIVLDNVETIFDNKKLMGELADLIILLDDSRYAKFGVKFLIVGIPSEVNKYFSTSKNSSSVGNRVEEIQRVSGLDYTQVLDLIGRGFIKYLKIEISETQSKETE